MKVVLFVVDDSVRLKDGVDAEPFELEMDFLRFRRRARLIRFVVPCESELHSESELLELEVSLDELDEFKISARMPGWDSSSIRC